MSSPNWETHIPGDMCSPTWEIRISSDISLVICVPLPGKHISLLIRVFDTSFDTCGGTLIRCDMCSPTPETHIPSDMSSPNWETHIPGDMCSPTSETHS